jgi:hypothetical protein
MLQESANGVLVKLVGLKSLLNLNRRDMNGNRASVRGRDIGNGAKHCFMNHAELV